MGPLPCPEKSLTKNTAAGLICFGPFGAGNLGASAEREMRVGPNHNSIPEGPAMKVKTNIHSGRVGTGTGTGGG